MAYPETAANIWDVASGKKTATFMVQDGPWCVVFSPDGKTLASGSHDLHGLGEIKLWDMPTAKRAEK